MTLLELLDHSKKDLPHIKKDNLIEESARIPDVFHKYHREYRSIRAEKSMIESQLQILTPQLWDYYKGSADPDVYKKRPLGKKYQTKEGLTMAINADPEILTLKTKLTVVEEKEDTVIKIMDQISQRQWLIRNMNESMKFFRGDN